VLLILCSAEATKAAEITSERDRLEQERDKFRAEADKCRSERDTLKTALDAKTRDVERLNDDVLLLRQVPASLERQLHEREVLLNRAQQMLQGGATTRQELLQALRDREGLREQVRQLGAERDKHAAEAARVQQRYDLYNEHVKSTQTGAILTEMQRVLRLREQDVQKIADHKKRMETMSTVLYDRAVYV